ncbi:MAG: glycosyltransferase, partial [Smithella sp.]
VNCHSLSVLPLCAVLKIRHKAKLVYDTHELETETANSAGFRKLLAKMTERVLVPFIDKVVVVNSDIARWYQNHYRLEGKISIIQNVPYRRNLNLYRSRAFRDRFGIGDEDIIFLYQGVLSAGRGISLLLDVFSQLDKSKHLVMLGYGPLAGCIQEYEKKRDNIHYHKAVPPGDLNELTSSADVGLSVIENICLSYYLCLPNKIFEYLNCGLPIIVSGFPGMGGFVDKYRCGWKVDVSRDSIYAIIHSIQWEAIREKQREVLRINQNFGLQFEEKTLLKLYRQIGFVATNIENETSSEITPPYQSSENRKQLRRGSGK